MTVVVTPFVQSEENNSTNFPCPRTYHASTLVDRFMVICGGESASNSDLNDLWALDLDDEKWFNPVINGKNSFVHKRFHTANSIMGTQVVTYGGCHSEYVHLNDLDIFELKDFIEDPQNNSITCVKIEVKFNIPTSRWGHAAVVHNQSKLLIIGGRNENDINDIHCYDAVEQSWSYSLNCNNSPKPRRRHSAVLLSNCLVMFGGFDGQFYDDLNLLNLKPDANQVVILPSTKDIDLISLVNSSTDFNVTVKILGPNSYKTMNVCKSLLLFRTIERERLGLPFNEKQRYTLQEVVENKECPIFIREVFYLQDKGKMTLDA
jgi:hypothetical protein